MIRVGIVGCGKMAEQHAVQIKRIAGAELIGVCDTEPLMARQLAERFTISNYFSSLETMLQSVRLDVVHITTPPQSHYALGKSCLAAGCHVYMEKPFTMDSAEAKELITIAEHNGLKITAGHNGQYTHAMIRMRELVKQGYLGGHPVHMECHYCYEFADKSYAKAFLGDSDHWVRKLPGSLLQNIISHGISKLAEFMRGDDPTVIAHGFTSPFLESIAETDIIDELRVIIKDEFATTAYFTFSSQLRPAPHRFMVYGPRRSLFVDDDHQILVKFDNKEFKSYLRYFVPPLGFAKQYAGNFARNFFQFLNKDFHLPNDAGLKTLIDSFYLAVLNKASLPINYDEILLTAKIMDSIFDQIRGTKADASMINTRQPEYFPRQ